MLINYILLDNQNIAYIIIITYLMMEKTKTKMYLFLFQSDIHFFWLTVRLATYYPFFLTSAASLRFEDHRGRTDPVGEETCWRHDPNCLLPECLCAHWPSAFYGKPTAEVRSQPRALYQRQSTHKRHLLLQQQDMGILKGLFWRQWYGCLFVFVVFFKSWIFKKWLALSCLIFNLA